MDVAAVVLDGEPLEVDGVGRVVVDLEPFTVAIGDG